MILRAVIKSAFTSASFTFVAMASSANFHVESYRALITLAGLELHGVSFVEVFDLSARRQTAPVKEYLVRAVVRGDKSVALLPDDFLDGSCHASIPPLVAAEPASNPRDRWPFPPSPLSWASPAT